MKTSLAKMTRWSAWLWVGCLTTAWCLYVFRLSGAWLPPIDLRDPEVFAARERAWGLDQRHASSADLELLRLGLGDAALS